MANEYLYFLPIKDLISEETNKPQILATLVPFETGSLAQEDEELSSEDNTNANKEDGGFEVAERSDKSTAVLLSEEELADLLKRDAEEEQEAEKRVLEEEEEVEMDRGKTESSEITKNEEAEVEDDKLGVGEGGQEVVDEVGKLEEENVEDAEMLDKVEVEVEKLPVEEPEGKSVKKVADKEERGVFFEEADGSTESEILADLDYAADSGILQPLQIVSGRQHPFTDGTKPLSKTEVKERETGEKGLPTITDDFEQDIQNTEAVDSGEVSDQDKNKDSEALSKVIRAHKQEHESNVDIPEPRGSAEFELGSRMTGKEEEKSKNDSGSHSKGKARKQKKNQRARKHSLQNEDPQSGQEQNQQESESSSTNDTVHKAKRRRAGKWVMVLFTVSQLFSSPNLCCLPSLLSKRHLLVETDSRAKSRGNNGMFLHVCLICK